MRDLVAFVAECSARCRGYDEYLRQPVPELSSSPVEVFTGTGSGCRVVTRDS
jgi:hypothetical protein